jgi:heptosyltransferase II
VIYIWLTWLTAPLWWPLAQVRSLAAKRPQRILIAEIAGIGDVVCSTAVFKAVREHYPQAHIALMVDTVVFALAKQDANLDEVIPFAYSAQRGLKGRFNLMRVMGGYDTLICLIPSAAQLSAACWAGLPRRLSVLPDVGATSYQWLAPLMTHTLSHQSNTPFVATQLRLLEPLGIQEQDLTRHLYVQESSRDRVHALLNRPATRWVGIAIGSGQGIKAIQQTVLMTLVRLLLQQDGIGIVLIGGVKEATLAIRLTHATPSARLVNAAGHIGLADLPALIEQLTVFVGVDSGVSYIADTLSIPMVYLPGPANPKDQGPIKAKRITLEKPLSCAPCSRVFVTPKTCITGTHECIGAFKADDIQNAVLSLLRETQHG